MKKFILLIILATRLTLAVVQDVEPAKRFLKAKQLIEENCSDCMGATREGLEQGIGEVTKAIDQGYKDRVAAYKLLARAYNTLTIYVEYDSQEYEALLDKIKPVFEKLSKLAPADPEIPFEYAIYLKDKEDQLAAYRKALKIDPHYAPARFDIGTIIISEGLLEAGIKEMKRAVRDANEIDAENYGRSLIGILKANNRWQEAEDIRKLVEVKKKRAEKKKTRKQD
jgi:tetratricopeptide (TPR) repeat protein